MQLARFIAFVFLLGFSPSPADCRTWHVNLERTGEAPTIQAAIDSSAVGDTVLVAPGTYTRANQDMLDYGLVVGLNKEICLRSEAGPGVTILDAQGEVIVVNIQAPEFVNISPILEGFTVMDGSADFADFGAGIRCDHTSPIIRDNVIRDNWVFRDGGGLACWYSDATVTGNVFVSNHSAVGRGAGIFCAYSSAVIENNTLVANHAAAGVIDCLASPTATISHNIVAYSASGAALGCGAGAPTIVCNCLWENSDGDGACTLGEGNFSADPLFCGYEAGDYRLHEDSPCAPGNSPSGCGLIGAMPIACWGAPLGPAAALLITIAVAAAGAWRIRRSKTV